ncbi:class I SAM-dependent methyltransferase [Thermoflavimicrobium dichotomicum]|uniref:SAM-dependent methyltransferase, MidA family n=1 Tax=Thermoflavimicrobium dichotomicum TaxID=46223 RepID=A0A1I3N7X6_9BACL|nr:SAM-dependent methyltransferase [Thermoflavimicrobium dichotomicum]SFJ05292.1 SAM-dependent methyltransferase, MidA family [Thermoflavimicrobium dichotomicum]
MVHSLQQVMIEEMKRQPMQALTFARWMELHLYHPKWGYYQKERQHFGKEGDFFTNVHVGEVFGKVLSQAIYRLSGPVGLKEPWALVEMGSGDGRLAEQVVTGLLEKGVSPDSFHLILVETSPFLRERQKERFHALPVSCQWAGRISELPRYPFSIVYSNELVDAFPVHRIRCVAGKPHEIYVTVDPESLTFQETLGPLSTADIGEYLQVFRIALDEGQTIEVNLQAYEWLKEVANWIETGYLLTIDYGGTTEELVVPERRNGTIRYIKQHRLLSNPYEDVGEVDVTSHVNFSSLMRWGEEWGLQTLSFQTQAKFLIEEGILDWYPKNRLIDPFSSESKQQRAIQQLIHPYGMGEVFRVLLQVKRRGCPMKI